MTTLVLQNFQLTAIANLLKDFPLKSYDSRMRSRFINILNERLEQLNKEKEALQEEYAERDENGEVIRSEQDGVEYITITDRVSLNKEIKTLMDEEFHIDLTSENKKTFATVLKVLHETEKEFADFEAQVYDVICTKLEELNLEQE